MLELPHRKVVPLTVLHGKITRFQRLDEHAAQVAAGQSQQKKKKCDRVACGSGGGGSVAAAAAVAAVVDVGAHHAVD